MSSDKTNFGQSLTHLIKGNIGAGVLAMPASFAHAGLIGASAGLPIICLVAVYCVHLLIKTTRLIESKSKDLDVNYSSLARESFEFGPKSLRGYGRSFGRIVDGSLLITQIGVCCIYNVFIVDNMISILASYNIIISNIIAFLIILPVTLLLCCIRTLRRLSIASLFANLLQAVGLAVIFEYLIRDLDQIDLSKRDHFRPINEMALGFGSAMFAFEGISVLLPIYSRMKKPKLMTSCMGVINVSFLVILSLNFGLGLLGYLKFGHRVRDSITLNLPAEPVYDAVRAMFVVSILLSYPLQFYAPYEIIWNWAKRNLLTPTKQELSVIRAIEVVIPPGTKVTCAPQEDKQSPPSTKPVCSSSGDKSKLSSQLTNNLSTKTSNIDNDRNYINNLQFGLTKENTIPLRYEYCCRMIIVLMTFLLAFSVPKLNLLMDLIGSFSGVALSLTIPSIIHLVSFWDESKGLGKVMMIIVDSTIIIISLIGGLGGSFSSLRSIIKSFN